MAPDLNCVIFITPRCIKASFLNLIFIYPLMACYHTALVLGLDCPSRPSTELETRIHKVNNHEKHI